MITILCNKSGLAYSIINASPERLAEMRLEGCQVLVPYDPNEPSHVAIRPGDVHDGHGKFSTPPTSREHRAQAHAALEELTMSLMHRAAEQRRTLAEMHYSLPGTPFDEALALAREVDAPYLVHGDVVHDAILGLPAATCEALEVPTHAEGRKSARHIAAYGAHIQSVPRLRGEIDAAATVHHMPAAVKALMGGHLADGWKLLKPNVLEAFAAEQAQ